MLVRVLFVCLGNICRSPMAEAVFRDMIKQEGLESKIEVDSAGTGGWHIGKPPHEGTRNVLDRLKISYEGMKARQVHENDFKQFHYIIALDQNNYEDLQHSIQGNDKCYLAKLMDFVNGNDSENVPDPYFSGNFDEVLNLVKEGCKSLLETIKERENL